MAIRLHEIELGASSIEQSTAFYTKVLGLEPTITQPNLSVFNSGATGLDFNISKHLPANVSCVSFLTDDLNEVIARLKASGIAYDGPFSSHLGMTSISFKDPDGCLIKVNTPTESSPEWLKV